MSDFCSCDWDPPMVWRDVERTARKEYRCEECRGQILPGERYQYATALDEPGMPWRCHRTCLPCVDGPMEWVMRNCGCYLCGGIEEHLINVFREHAFQHPGSRFRLGRLLVGMRRRRGDGLLRTAA